MPKLCLCSLLPILFTCTFIEKCCRTLQDSSAPPCKREAKLWSDWLELFSIQGNEELIRSAWDTLLFLLTFALKGHENRPYIIIGEPQGWLARAFPKGAINQALQLHFLLSFWFSFYAAVTQLLCKLKDSQCQDLQKFAFGLHSYFFNCFH